MTKEKLARILSFCTEGTEYSIVFIDIDKMKGKDSTQWIIEYAANCADVKIIKGRCPQKGQILASRGAELPYIKPVTIIEYPHHWPCDFCYLYNL